MTESANKLTLAFEQALHRVAQHDREVGPEHRTTERTAMLEGFEAETVEALQQILGEHIAKLDVNDETRALLDRLIAPTHQVEIGALMGILVAVGYIMAQGIMSGPVSALSIESMRLAGMYTFSPTELADGWVRNWISEDDARNYMRDSGIRQARADVLRGLARNSLSPPDWINFWRLYPEQEQTVDEGLSHSGLDGQSIAALKGMHLTPPSIRFAAQAVTQNQIDMPTFERLLLVNGINPEWGKAIYETEGATMPPTMANRLFREHRIDQKEYEQILLESDLKNKYVPLMALLRYRVPPMRQIVAAFHNGSLPREEAALRLDKLGFDVVDQNWMLDSAAKSTGSAGKHLSMQQHLAAYEAQLESREAATAALVAIGWAPADVELEFDVADHRATLARTSRAANAIGIRYVGWKIDRHSASVALDALGLPSAARDEALQAWDIEREEKRPHLTFVQLQHGFKKGAIDLAGVRGQLVDMGYDSNQVNFLMATYF